MSIESISSINCNARNDYDKKFCTGLNPDKIDNFLKPYQIEPFNYFDKNIFSLHDEKEVIADLSKEKCSTHTINNNYGGFHFKGDKNKCLLFNSNNFDKNNENKFKNYNIKTFIKTKDTIDFENNKDQLDSSKYLTEINNKDYLSDGIIKEIDVSNETECFDKCIRNYGDCKSLIYMKQPELCTFYNDKKMDIQPNKNKDYDTYTTKKNKLKAQKNIINNLFRDQNNLDDEYYYCSLNNDNCVLDYSFNQNKEEDKDQLDRTDRPDISIYNCSGLESTNPFCTKIYNENDYKLEENIDNSLNYTNCIKIDNINNQNKLFNKECKKKYGYEYVFDNDKFNMNSVINCKDNSKKGKCKLHLDNINDINEVNESNNINKSHIEHFSNKNKLFSGMWLKENKMYLLIIFFIFIILLVLLYSLSIKTD